MQLCDVHPLTLRKLYGYDLLPVESWFWQISCGWSSTLFQCALVLLICNF